jgi:hypothetical protein
MAGAFSEYYPEGMPDPSVMPQPDVPPSLWARLKAAMTPPSIDQSAAHGRAGAAGILNAGGATSSAARTLGFPGAADWLEKSEGADPGAAAGASLVSPATLLGPIKDLGTKLYHDFTDAPPEGPDSHIKTKDEFLQGHQKPQLSLQETVDKARNDFTSSPAYKALVDSRHVSAKQREAQVQQVIDQAKQTYKDNQGAVAEQRGQIEKDYTDYIADQNKKLKAQHSMSFAARHPAIADLMVGTGTLGAGLMTRGLLSKIAKTGQGYVDSAETALKNPAGALDFALNANKADKYANSWNGAKLRVKQGVAVALPATAPIDMRGMGDAYDAWAQPTKYIDASGDVQDNPVQKEALGRISHPVDYFMNNLPAYGSGLIGSALLGKTAKAAPLDAINSLLDTEGIKSKMGAFNDVRKAAGMDSTAEAPVATGAFAPEVSEALKATTPTPLPKTEASAAPVSDMISKAGRVSKKAKETINMTTKPREIGKAADTAISAADKADLEELVNHVKTVNRRMKKDDIRQLILDKGFKGPADVQSYIDGEKLKLTKSPDTMQNALEDAFRTPGTE